MSSPLSAGLALTLEHRICKPVSLPNLLTWRGESDGGEEGEKWSWGVTRGPLLFHSELPEVRICAKVMLSAGQLYIREKVLLLLGSDSQVKQCFDMFFFISADITGIEYLGSSQQMWSSTQANTDLSLCLLFRDCSLDTDTNKQLQDFKVHKRNQ